MTSVQTETQIKTQPDLYLPAQGPSVSFDGALLTSNRLLGTLSDQGRAELVRTGTWTTFPESNVVSRQGRTVDAVTFIVHGKARAEIAPPDRQEFRAVVNLLTPGDDIGLLSLVDGGPHSATVTSLEELRALSVPVSAMQKYLEDHPEWYKMLAEIAVARLRTSGHWLQALI